MTRRRWIADQVSGDRAFLLGRNAEHLARVLRARAGQEFEISTGDQVRLGRVLQVTQDRVEFSLGDVVTQREGARVSLLLAVFKFDRMEWAIEKATELGAADIFPVVARRTEAHLAKAAGKRAERWRRIAHEAAQQSRRVAPPDIRDPLPLKSALSLQSDLRIVLAENKRGSTLKEILARNPELATRNSQLALAIGPEGGWTDDELLAFEEAGWTSASLGPTILRAETAAVAALAIAMSELT
jgi:16S rRNA (uracil1498-N3)-methyltransferase